MTIIRQTNSAELADLEFNFEDKRLPEMLFRYRCRNYPETLGEHDRQRWEQYRMHRMTTESGAASIKYKDYLLQLKQLRGSELTPEKQQLLDQLDAYPALIGIN